MQDVVLAMLAKEPAHGYELRSRRYEARAAGQPLVVVTHDARIAAVADRVIAIRDGAFADDTRLTATASTIYDGRR